MRGIDVPSWCQWRLGPRPLLIVAPHGGRRERQPGDGAAAIRKVNDLHTAELAAALADRLGASLLVNASCDRNLLDLNRVSQVASRAPWFLALLEHLLDAIVGRDGRAELLFIHGWNVVQARCDIGIGANNAEALAGAGAAEALTVSPAFAAERLTALQRACARRGIAVSVGERYPGRHPNNLLQLFRRGTPHPGHPPLAAWAAPRAIEAVQLELGAALRWPGAARDAFVAAAVEAFASTAPAGRPVRRAARGAVPQSASLQLYDAEHAVGLSLRMDAHGPTGPTGRVLALLGPTRTALYIGEAAGGGPPGEGPEFTTDGDGVAVRFDGYALATDEAWRYVDLEDAFAASELVRLRVALRFRPGLSPDYGQADGSVEIGGTRFAVAAPAFTRHGILQRGGSAWLSQLTMTAAFGARRALRVRLEVPGQARLHELTPAGERQHPLPPLAVHFAGDRCAPDRIALGRVVLCRPLTRMSIVRPLDSRRRARLTFGAAAFEEHGAVGYGFYEYGRLVGA